MKTKLEKISYLAAEFKNGGALDLGRFAERLATDPAGAFEWGQKAITAAARHHVATMLESYVPNVRKNQPDWTDDQIADCIISEVHEELLRKSRWPEHSTSAVMISQERTAAMAEFIARMEGK